MLYTFRKFIQHYASATLIDVLHSPFVFDLYNYCFKKNSLIVLPFEKVQSTSYMEQRCISIIQKTRAHFPHHQFTSTSSLLASGEPTILYMENIVDEAAISLSLQTAHNHSMVIVRNMYQSVGATASWKRLTNNVCATATIDLFFIGFIFVRKEQRKQYFKLRLF